jgi:hypothetical protein
MSLRTPRKNVSLPEVKPVARNSGRTCGSSSGRAAHTLATALISDANTISRSVTA